jgi:hypothetical protein
LSIVVGALLLPALLIGGWGATWSVPRSRRWIYYFPVALAVVLLVAAVAVLTPRRACASSSPMMCLDDVSLFGMANALSGVLTWVVLLAVTGGVELARHVAYVSRLRRTTGEGPAGRRPQCSGGTDQQPGGLSEPVDDRT